MPVQDAPNLKAIVFDMDGVLVDTSPCHDQAYRRLWQQQNLPLIEYGKLAGRSTREVIQQYCGHLSESAQRACVSFKQAQALILLQTADIIFADTVSSIQHFHRQGYKLGLATSASTASANLVLDRLGVRHLFDAVVTADQVERAKPHPDVFTKAMQVLDLEPSQCLVIEDSVAGIHAGLASGALVVNVRNRIQVDQHKRFKGYYDNLEQLNQTVMSGAL